MKRIVIVGIVFLFLSGIGFGLYLNPNVVAEISERIFADDPDIPDFAKDKINKEEFRQKRSDNLALIRGIDITKPFDPQHRIDGIRQMERQEENLARNSFAPQAAWTEIGPAPIPNGQTNTITTPVSGRVTAIDVHPTNADIVYVGTAQGGVYRSLDAGATWTAILENGLSLAIGAVRIAPSQPETVYVGTGEANFSSDSYFGVGIYRIDNAGTTATVSGPFGTTTPFQGRSIGEIIVHPSNPAMIWVASASAVAAINGGAGVPTLSNRGIYRSDNATGATPTFAQLPTPFVNQNLSVRDIEIDPLNPDLLVANVIANGGGIVVYNNAMVSPATSAVGVQRQTWSSTSTSELTAEIAIQRSVGAPQPTIYVGTGNGGGRVLISTDGGVNYTQQIDNNFCTPQCFYDIAIDTDPNDPTRVYIGGAPAVPFASSINSGTTFVNSSVGLHVDSHAITVAPSNPNRIYFGSDGGIYRSDNLGVTWNVLNNATFSATQFMSLDVHPSDPNITIGGTQDNGTNRYTSAATWTRTDFGDGGYSVIDQSSTNTTTFNQYHTYFNASNLTGYAFSNSSTAFENWTFRGCNGVTANGISCTATINFYAPLERGPGTPNSIYYGSDRLYRSVDTGSTHTTVSQTFTSPLSAIGISPQNDNVRLIGRNDGGIFGTTTGVSPLVDFDPTNVIPNNYVTRTIIDPLNVNTAYVTLALFNGTQVWKTTTLNSFAETGLVPTWTAANNGLPLVPVNAFLVDPIDSNRLYAGTDIGMYTSGDGGANWIPFGTGLPRIAVFDIAITPGTPATRQIRIATHGRGMWQTPALAPSAANVSVSGRVVAANGRAISRARVTLINEQGNTRTIQTNAFGYFSFEEVESGQTYTLQTTAKAYQFQPQVISINEEISGLVITAE